MSRGCLITIFLVFLVIGFIVGFAVVSQIAS